VVCFDVSGSLKLNKKGVIKMWDPYAEFKHEVLPNGLSLYATHWSGKPWEAVGFLIHSGAEQDKPGLEGTAHFVEHLVSENTEMGADRIRDFFEDHGGNVDLGRTGYFGTIYDFMIPSNRPAIRKALRIFGEMLLASNLNRFVERERRVIIGEFHRNFPLNFIFEQYMRWRKAMHPGTWMERFASPLGSPRSIEVISSDELEVFYRRHYDPANMSIVAVGGLKFSEVKKLISESPFGSAGKGFRNRLSEKVTDFPPLSDQGGQMVFSQHVILAKPRESGAYESHARFSGDANWMIIRMLSRMLDDVLTEEIRSKRGWTYHIGTEWSNFRGFYDLEIECRDLEVGSLGEIRDVVEVSIASLFDRQDLFEKLKKRWLASLRVTDISGQKVRDETIDDLNNYGRIITLAEMLDKVEQLDFSEVRKTLGQMKPELRWTLVVEP